MHRLLAGLLCIAASLCWAFHFDIETGNDLYILKAGEESSLYVKVTNDTGKTIDKPITYQVTDISGAVITQETVRALVASQEYILIPLKAPEKFGPYILRCAEDGADVRQQVPLRFAYMKPTGPRDRKDVSGFKFGNVLHFDNLMYRKDDFFRLASDADLERAVKVMAWVGANVIRFDARWDMMEPQEGVWTPEYFDKAMNWMHTYNLGTAPIINHGAKWAIAKDWVAADPDRPYYSWQARPDYTHWRNWARKLLQEYGDRFDYLEVLNEINGGANYTADEYGELLKIVYEEVKANAPHVKVMSSGLMSLTTNRTATPDWMERYGEAIKGNYDIDCYHQHGPLGGAQTEMGLAKGFRDAHKITTPFWFNEIGLAVKDTSEELFQAETLFHKLLYVWASGSIGYTWYNVRNKPQSNFEDGSYEPFFGIVTRDFHPRPVAIAFNTITANLFNATFQGDLNEDERAGHGTYAYLFKNEQPDTYTMALFRMTRDSTLEIVQNVTGEATLIDLWGNETALAVQDGTTAFTLDSHPVFVRFTSQAAAPELTGEFLPLGGQLLYSGQEQALVFDIRNSTSSDMNVAASLSDVPGIEFGRQDYELTIPQGASEKMTILCKANPEFRKGDLVMHIQAGTLWEGDCTVTLTAALKAAPEFSESPTLVINEEEQNERLVAVSPEDEPFYWKGPEDCSAEVWLAQNSNRLKFHIEVTDDAHANPWHGTDVWQGDNVQLGIQIPRQAIYWEIGLTHCDDGTSEAFIWFAPPGFDRDIATRRIVLATRRDEDAKKTIYDAEIPFNAIGLTPGIGKSGFLFNMLVNDCDDGKTREGYMSFKQGLGNSKETSDFSKVCF